MTNDSVRKLIPEKMFLSVATVGSMVVGLIAVILWVTAIKSDVEIQKTRVDGACQRVDGVEKRLENIDAKLDRILFEVRTK